MIPEAYLGLSNIYDGALTENYVTAFSCQLFS